VQAHNQITNQAGNGAPNDSLVSILGGGPAGASAAIAARLEGKQVHLIDGAKFPRHKVCGEFFSPEIATELDQLGAWDAFLQSGPARVHRMKLHFGAREKIARLPESAWGLSRYAFDLLLRDRAQGLGAELVQECGDDEPSVIACGRNRVIPEPGTARSTTIRARIQSTGSRLFGFKAHFEGPVDDAVELFFFSRCYVGINAIENRRTNVCGLGPENFLRQFQFEYDRVILQCPALADRLAPLRRSTKWFSTGPLHYAQAFGPLTKSHYLAGDALSFVDPFTGSGLLAAVKTGAMAGQAAARREPAEAYYARCQSILKQPFEIASIFRAAVDGDWLNDRWTSRLARLIPSRALFSLTRPRS